MREFVAVAAFCYSYDSRFCFLLQEMKNVQRYSYPDVGIVYEVGEVFIY
jgi:hypothetical protein